MQSDRSGPLPSGKAARARDVRLVALLACSLLLSAGVGLAALRAMRPVVYLTITGRAPSPAASYRRPHPLYHHGFVPGARALVLNRETLLDRVEFRINSLGMRDPERMVPKPPGTFRVLMLGDSFIAGRNLPAERTAAAVLERLLGAGSPEPVEVVNGGCISYSPILEYLFLKHVGLRVQPDLVVLNLDMSDIHDDWFYALGAELDAAGVPLRVPPEEAHAMWPPRTSAGAEDFRVNPALLEDRYFHTRSEELDPLTLRHFEETWGHILRIAQLAEDSGARFLLTSYPMGHQVSSAEWDVGRRLLGFESRRYTGPIFSFLERRAREEGVEYLDMLPGFRAWTGERLFLRRDGHWTEAGHRLAARLVAEKLRRIGWERRESPRIANRQKAAAAFRHGMVALKGGRLRDAEESWLEAARLVQHFMSVDLKLGQLFLRTGRLELALPRLVSATEVGPTDPLAWKERGVALMALGRGAEAGEAFERARVLGSGDPIPEAGRASFRRPVRIAPGRSKVSVPRGPG